MVKDSVSLILLLENVGLYQFEDVSAHCLHWLDHGIVLGLVVYDSVRNLLAVEIVNLE